MDDYPIVQCQTTVWEGSGEEHTWLIWLRPVGLQCAIAGSIPAATKHFCFFFLVPTLVFSQAFLRFEQFCGSVDSPWSILHPSL